MANTYLQRTVSSAGNRKTFTYSAWVKRCSVDSTHYIVTQGADSSNNWTIVFDGANRLQTWNYVGGFQYNLKLTRLFRDTNAWYHIVLAVDTTQATASDRVKIYVNGVQQTSFVSGEDTYPSQNTDMYVNSTSGTFRIGYYTSGGSYFNGVMSHVHFCDGTALAPTVFGSTDSTTGEWKINTSPSFTPGTNGFTVLKDGNTITDQSTNSNNFTVSGNLTNTEDCPSNVFATLNPLWKDTVSAGAITYSNGNTSFHPNIDGNSFTRSTLGASSGKYYIEIKATEVNTGQSTSMNIVPSDEYGASHSSSGTYGFQIQLNSTNTQLKKEVEGSSTTINSSFSSGSIAMMAVDLDNGKMWIGYNGTWYNNNNPSSTLDTNNPDITGIATSVDYLIGFRGYMQGGYPSGYYNQANVNFGNGYFGTTAVSSAGTNASGNGIFEYDVPTGYTALSTKGLNL
jgi:hypothetical protein